MAPTFDVWSWPGWGAISAWASILALATIVTAAWRFVIQRRQASAFHLDWTVLGTQTRDEGTYHLIEFVNVGRGFGYIDSITFMNASVHLVEGHLAPKTLGSGQTFRLLITAPSMVDVWLLTMTREPDDFTAVTFRWEPLLPSGPLRRQFMVESRAWAKRTPLQRWKDRHRPRPVAPGSQLIAKLRAGSDVDVTSVISFEGVAIIGSAAAGDYAPADLPYLGPDSLPTLK